jgi:hypothetical protein
MMKKVKTHRVSTVGFLLPARVVLAQSVENLVCELVSIGTKKPARCGLYKVVSCSAQ